MKGTDLDVDPGPLAPMRISLPVDGSVAVHVESYGHVHGVPAGRFDLTVDLRDFIRDPHISPDLRAATGRELVVRVHVLATPGARDLVEHLTGAATALLDSAPTLTRPVRVGVACQGGRHRSVAVAEVLAERLVLAGDGVLVIHHHVNAPVTAHREVTG